MEPDYKKIYKDIIKYKKPEKQNDCNKLLKKEKLTVLDIIRLNTIIFGTCNREIIKLNQKHRSYDKQAILDILAFQKENDLSNVDLALKFRISRNTVARWKKFDLYK